MNSVRSDIRNVAIIAHVDHGKTTLVDALLRQSGNFRKSQVQQDTLLDSNPLERERGITILAKNVAIHHVGPDGKPVKINLIDTPGHADFGGEVERVLGMADGVFLLVDAAEGPMPQTRFVLKKAFQHQLRPIVVINKIDRSDARAHAVLDEVFDLFVELGADDETLDFPVLYASGRAGTASWSLETPGVDIQPVFEALLKHVPAPHGDPERTLQMQISSILYNDYVGRIGVGRIYNGVIKTGQQVTVVRRDGTQIKSKVQQVQLFDGLGRTDVESASAGDIAALVGLESVDISDSICDPSDPQPLEAAEIEPPTLTMMFSVNDSPFCGKEGKYVTSRNLRERLFKELESNVALKVEESGDKDAFRVAGRGLLHLGILIENMRREGYELSISKPHVILKKDADGKTMEPIEYLAVDVPEKNLGGVMELVGNRRGEMVRMDNRAGHVHLEFTIPARGLIGLRTRMMTATQGQAVMHHNFHEYAPMRGEIPSRNNGVMVSNVGGSVNAYALNTLQERGILFVEPTDPIYEGQLAGEHCREDDIVVNPTKVKKLSNMRTTSSDENIILKPARKMTLEQALEYIEEDELVEVTPQSIRLRKEKLTENERKRANRSGKVETVEVEPSMIDKIFKAYDVRATYPDMLSEPVAWKIGHASAQFLRHQKVSPGEVRLNDTIVVGRDMRLSSPSLAKALCDGIRAAGLNVIDIGMIDTSMIYFAINHLGALGGIQTTASHNPAQYNGFKISGPKARPIGSASGLDDIKRIAASMPQDNSAASANASPVGDYSEMNLWAPYRAHVLKFLELKRPLRVVVDGSNGMAGKMVPAVFGDVAGLTLIPLLFEITGKFTHEPNPLVEANLDQLKERIRGEKPDLGACFDGDADRCVFLDETGRLIGSDLATALLARDFLKEPANRGATIVYDLRSSRVVADEITLAGGVPRRDRVGHAFIKKTLAETSAVFGGELSGHFYFRDNFFADSGAIAFARLLSIVSAQPKPLSELVAPLRRYHQSGEINFQVPDKDAKIRELARTYPKAEIDYLDGITINNGDWWFNVRASNTEPLLRLNLEAQNQGQLDEKFAELKSLLGEPVHGH